MKKRSINIVAILAIVVLAGIFVWLMNYSFDHSDLFRSLFSGANSDAFGEVAANSEASIASRNRLTARISMYIFSGITVLQFIAVVVGAAAISGIRHSGESPDIRIKRLENAEIFFDVPLYVGLFGTVSAFLVMTFSPQSSRLIAYSSTLIGIIFSLLLRLTLQYPLRQQLTTAVGEQEK